MISSKSLTQMTSPRNIYLLGLVLMVVGMPLSKFLMSVGQFVLAASFLLDGKFKIKTQWLLINTPALVLCGLFLLHLLGMVHTSDYPDGWKDLRIKFPLFVMPILIATAEPLERKQFENILLLFLLAVFAGSMVSLAVLTGIIHRPVTDIRDIFIFHISHIRFALFTCLSVFIIAYLLWRHQDYHLFKKVGLVVLALWLMVFLAIMESVTGIAILIVVFTAMLLYYASLKVQTWKRIAAVFFALVLPAATIYTISSAVKEYYLHYNVDFTTLDKTTRNNHPYVNNPLDTHTENGHRIWIYVCDDELREEWNKRSTFYYDSSDMKGQALRYTLVRYMTSKGLRKDADGVKALGEEDVRAIEHGIANVNYGGFINLKGRIHQIIWEYDNYKESGNPSGHSVMQRLEFWKAAYAVFKDHFWFGVGTGDLENAYHSEYNRLHSPLDEKYRLHAHNQYLAIGAALGIFGLVYFFFSLIYPMMSLKKVYNFLYITFWITAILSMLTEDTLETQAGVTFFAFFNSFYLFAYDSEKQ